MNSGVLVKEIVLIGEADIFDFLKMLRQLYNDDTNKIPLLFLHRSNLKTTF